MTFEAPKPERQQPADKAQPQHRDLTIEMEARLMQEMPQENLGEWIEKHGGEFREYVETHGERLLEQYQNEPEVAMNELRAKFLNDAS